MKTNPTDQTDKATPRPWTNRDGIIYGNEPMRDNDEIVICDVGPENIALDEFDIANAALIVRAVNEHAALLAVAEAAKRAPQWLGKMIADGAHMNCVAPNDCAGTLQRLETTLANLAKIQSV